MALKINLIFFCYSREDEWLTQIPCLAPAGQCDMAIILVTPLGDLSKGDDTVPASQGN